MQVPGRLRADGTKDPVAAAACVFQPVIVARRRIGLGPPPFRFDTLRAFDLSDAMLDTTPAETGRRLIRKADDLDRFRRAQELNRADALGPVLRLETFQGRRHHDRALRNMAV